MKKKEQVISLFEYRPEPTDAIERQVLKDAVDIPSMVTDIAELVDASMFTTQERQDIWNAITDFHAERQDINYISVAGRVPAFTEEVLMRTSVISSVTGCVNNARALRNAAIRIRTYNALSALVMETCKPENGEAEIYAAVEDFRTQVQGSKPVRMEATIAEVVQEIAEETEERERLAAEGKAFRIRTSLPSLDTYTLGGFGPGQLVILAARPSVGKTALMLQMARRAATDNNPVEIFSLEMTEQELGQRMLYSTDLVGPFTLAAGTVNWQDFELGAKRIASLPIYINDKTRTINEIVSRMSLAVERGHCKIAFIDYLGLMDADDDPRTPLYQRIARITGMLKNTAKRLRIPIVLLCQLNRESAKGDRAPELYDLRDSGSIEQDADIVLMLAQELKDVPVDPEQPKDVNVWVRKNRQGKKDICIRIRPNDTYTNFEEISTSL